MRLTAHGGTFASELNGLTVAPSDISVLLPSVSGNTSVQINPLTDFINSLVVGKLTHGLAPNLATALSNASAMIQKYYGLHSDPSTLAPDYTVSGIGTDSGNLALVLGALAAEELMWCQSPGSPTLSGALTAALSSDISDGIFDGSAFGQPVTICGQNLWSIAGTTEFEDALSGLLQLQISTVGFIFGGTGNVLTANGVTPDLLLSSVRTINSAIAQAAPRSINSFAAANATVSMSSPRSYATANLLFTGQVLVAGGLEFSPFQSQQTTDLYIPNTNTFSASPPLMNVPRAHAASAQLDNGQILIAGGVNIEPSTNTNTIDVFNPLTNTFAAPMPVMSTNRDRLTVTLLAGGNALIGGGFVTVNSTNSTDLYETTPNSFATSPVMNFARRDASATLLPSGEVLIAGGHSVLGTAVATTELYDPISVTFAPAAATARMNVARAYAASTLLPNGKLLIVGGSNSTTSNSITFLKSTELYDSATNTFAPAAATPVMNSARQGASATLLPNGKVLIAGGYNGKYLATTEIYDPTSNTVTAGPNMNNAREWHTATLLPNGKVLLAGGHGSSGAPIATTELYTP
jgi:hypothetical protein